MHEDDVCDCVSLFVFDSVNGDYEVLNLTPSDYVFARDIAGMLRKPTMRIAPFLVRVFFFFFMVWHARKVALLEGGLALFLVSGSG